MRVANKKNEQERNNWYCIFPRLPNISSFFFLACTEQPLFKDAVNFLAQRLNKCTVDVRAIHKQLTMYGATV